MKHVCEFCGKEFEQDYRRDDRAFKVPVRFCSRSCATKSSAIAGKGKLKEKRCTRCGDPVLVLARTSSAKVVCESCRTNEKEALLKKPRACIYCNRVCAASNIERHEKACRLNPSASHSKRLSKRADVRTGYIYRTTNKLNGKIYIGKHAGEPAKSLRYIGSGIALQKAVAKYGIENFFKDILEEVVEGDLNERERFWIKELNSFSEHGYNLTSGGDGGATFGGRHHSEKTKQLLRDKSSRGEAVFNSVS